MIQVICFYWQGDRWRDDEFKEPENHINKQKHHLRRIGTVTDDLAVRYVNNLYQGVRRFANQPFKFICFTNENLHGINDGVELRNFEWYTRHGVLPRLYMFSKQSGLFGNQVLCLDLDIVITGSLKNIMNYRGKFCARSKFKRGEEYKLDGDIMSFYAGKESEDIFWEPFIKDIDSAVELTQGRERYWMRYVAGSFAERWDNYAPGEILGYKRHVQRRKTVSKNASIVSCHGFPRPHQINDNWIKEYWN